MSKQSSLRWALLLALVAIAPAVAASVIIERNPFDPSRKPSKVEVPPPPPLPELTPKDLQIEAIISFGQFRGVVAQLDGKLKGSLPANAAGKVRIAVGQSFGGYVLESVEPRGATIQGGSRSFMVPVVRRTFSGSAPAPAMAAPAPAHVETPPPAPMPSAAPSLPAAISAAATPSGGPFGQPASPAGVAPAPTSAAAAAAPQESAAQAQPPQGGAMTLLDAIRQAQDASKARSAGGANAAPQGVPFGGK